MGSLCISFANSVSQKLWQNKKLKKLFNLIEFQKNNFAGGRFHIKIPLFSHIPNPYRHLILRRWLRKCLLSVLGVKSMSLLGMGKVVVGGKAE